MRALPVIMGELTASRARLVTLRAAVPPNAVAIAAEVVIETRLVGELNAAIAAAPRLRPAPLTPRTPRVLRPAHTANAVVQRLGAWAIWIIGSVVVAIATLMLLGAAIEGGSAWINSTRGTSTSMTSSTSSASVASPVSSMKTAEEIADCRRRIANTPPYIDPTSLRGRSLCK